MHLAGGVRGVLKRNIVLDALRTPVVELPVAAPNVQRIKLMMVRQTKPRKEFSPVQLELLEQLGIKGTTYTAILPDNNATLTELSRLGEAVTAQRMSAELPVWAIANEPNWNFDLAPDADEHKPAFAAPASTHKQDPYSD